MKQFICITVLILTTCFGWSQTREQDSLTIQLAFQKDDTSKVKTSINLIKSLYKTKDYQKAFLYIQQSERLASELEFDRGLAEIKYFKALIYTQNDDYYNALDNYTRSLNTYTKLKDSLSIAKVHNSLGLVEIKRRNYNKGLKHSLSAIEIFESRNLLNELSLAYNNLAEAYFNTNHVDKALQFNLKAYKVQEDLRDSLQMKITTTKIAELYSKRKEHRKAIEYYDRALGMMKDGKDDSLKAKILPCIGEEYLLFKDYTNAEPYLREGLSFNRTLKRNKGTFKSLNNLADLRLQQNRLRASINFIAEASKIAPSISDDKLKMQHFRVRAKYDSVDKNYERAYNWQRQYNDLRIKLERQKLPPVPLDDDPFEIETSLVEEPSIIDTPDHKFPRNLIDYKELTYVAYALFAAFILLLISLLSLLFGSKRKSGEIEKVQQKKREFAVLTKELKSENAQLKEQNNVKDRLFSIVSHDLKDSITSIKAFLDLLKEDSISEDEFNELIPELSENADNASALLLNLLNWSKSQMQNLEPKATDFNIQEIFTEKMNLVQNKVQKKRVVLLDESIRDFAYADRSMIEIVVQNLLANAVKFSRVGDVITVSNREKNGQVLVCIEDTGVGISKENQAKLFGAANYTTRGTGDEKGTGLGLSICKQLVELNNGKIWVESDLGQGSKFFFTIPKSKSRL
ncbi:MAG: tetratricopeptide repeat-containing sensor histidine kinase [bacterium]